MKIDSPPGRVWVRISFINKAWREDGIVRPDMEIDSPVFVWVKDIRSKRKVEGRDIKIWATRGGWWWEKERKLTWTDPKVVYQKGYM